MAEPVEDYPVGYRKPPKHTQFQKGRSGNPSGRPKGAKNYRAMIRSVFDQKVVIVQNGVRKSISKLEAGLMQLANKAASGDVRAIREVLRIIALVDNPAAPAKEGLTFIIEG